MSGGLVAFAGAWLALPLLQGPRRTVEEEVSVELERARRLLDNYVATLTYEGLLRDRLAATNVQVDADALSTEAQDDYQQVHTALWEAYTPRDWPEGGSPRPARPNYGNLTNQIKQGLETVEPFLAENQRRLDKALQVVNHALSITANGESARSDAEANRLKGTVLYHIAQTKRLEAQIRRREGSQYRRSLLNLASQAEAAQIRQRLVAASEVDKQIGVLQAEVSDVAASLTKDRAALAALDGKIEVLDGRLQEAAARRQEARGAMEALQAQGIDLSDPQGGEKFATQLRALSAAFRKANRRAQALEHGSYVSADAETGDDDVSGMEAPPPARGDRSVEYGLNHFRDERKIVAARITGLEHALEGLKSDMARLTEMRSGYLQTQGRAEQQLAQARTKAQELFADLNRSESEAAAVEEKGLDLARQAAAAFRQASQYADQWIRDARNRTQGLSPAQRDRSPYGRRLQDEWMGGFIAAEEADALLTQAWLHFDRYDAARRSAETLADVKTMLQLAEADPESESAKAREAQEAGIDAITQAVKVLERAHRETDRPWTVVAQAAGATYLLTLFGQDEYVKDAIEAYRNAVKGQEDEAFAQVFVSRLNQLEESQ